VKRFCLDAGLANPAAGEGFAVAVGIGAGDRGVAHPDLLVGPAFKLRARLHRLTEQGPLRAIGGAGRIHQIGRHIPPLDPVIRMRTVIFRKGKNLAGTDVGEPASLDAEPGKTLRQRALAAESEKHGAGREGAA
jgi:hypothetical protein